MSARKHIRKIRVPKPMTPTELARLTRENILMVLGTLLFCGCILYFRVGEAIWPAWLAENRIFFLPAIIYAVIFISLLSPVMVEASKRPRDTYRPPEYSKPRSF